MKRAIYGFGSSLVVILYLDEGGTTALRLLKAARSIWGLVKLSQGLGNTLLFAK